MLFLSTPSARRATSHSLHPLPCQTISIHALREEGDIGQKRYGGVFYISIHALREEGDRNTAGRLADRPHFYPRPPRGGRRASTARRLSFMQFLSTPSARRATTAVSFPASCRDNFYPRPPRGGRHRPTNPQGHQQDFYPRPPRGGRHLAGVLVNQVAVISIHALREEGDAYHLVSRDV